MKKARPLPGFLHLIKIAWHTHSVFKRWNKVAAKRPETKEGGREEEKSRSRIASGLDYARKASQQ
jgi:hypothetical protein